MKFILPYKAEKGNISSEFWPYLTLNGRKLHPNLTSKKASNLADDNTKAH